MKIAKNEKALKEQLFVQNTYSGTDHCIEAAMAAQAYAESIGATLIMSMPEGIGIPEKSIKRVDGFDLYLEELLNAGAIITLPD